MGEMAKKLWLLGIGVAAFLFVAFMLFEPTYGQ
jgi:hypothetical protein